MLALKSTKLAHVNLLLVLFLVFYYQDSMWINIFIWKELAHKYLSTNIGLCFEFKH